MASYTAWRKLGQIGVPRQCGMEVHCVDGSLPSGVIELCLDQICQPHNRMRINMAIYEAEILIESLHRHVAFARIRK